MFNGTKNILFFRGFYVEFFMRLSKYSSKMLKNPKWFLMSIAGRFNLIRSLAKRSTKQPYMQEYRSRYNSSNFKNINPVDVVNILNKDGFYSGINLPNCLVQEILEFAYSNPCYGNLDPSLGFLYSEKEKISKHTRLFTAQYFNTSWLCPTIKTLARDPKIIEIASMYLEADPVFTGSRLWWNFTIDDEKPYNSNKTITFFHYDLDDYACCRFFFI